MEPSAPSNGPQPSSGTRTPASPSSSTRSFCTTPPASITLIRSRYDALAHRFPWQAGDIAILDNMLISHARDPFTGPRKILVTMGDMASRQDVTSADTPVTA